MRRHFFLAIWVGGIGSIAIGQAMAQPRAAAAGEQIAAPAGEYEVLIKKAIVEFDLGHWSEAKAFFVRAHALRPSARTLRSLGLVSYEQRLYVEALTYLEQALASQVHPLTEPMREQAEVEIREAKSFVTYARVTVEPERAVLRVDGLSPVYARDGSVMLDPGQRELTAQAPGCSPASRRVRATGGHLDVSMRLQPNEPLAATAKPVPSKPGSADDSVDEVATGFWSGLSTPNRIGLGLGAGAVIAAGVGVTFAVLALDEKAASKRGCVGDLCDTDGLRHRRAALARADAASVSFVAAGALLAGGAALLFAVPGAEHDPAAVAVAPEIGPGVATLELRAGF